MLLACNNSKTESQIELNKQNENSETELLLKSQLVKSQNFALNKLKLNSISKLKSTTLRIWRFPGGGACFEELYELNIDKKELKLYSYLIENIRPTESENISDLEYQKVINNNELTEKLIRFSNEKSLLNFKNSNEYCKSNILCGDSFLVEFKNNFGQNTFSLNSGIKKCSNKNTESLKELFDLIEKTSSEYSNK